MKELHLTIIGLFEDEEAIRLAEDAKNAKTAVDRTAMEKEVVHGFTELARSPKIEEVKLFDV